MSRLYHIKIFHISLYLQMVSKKLVKTLLIFFIFLIFTPALFANDRFEFKTDYNEETKDIMPLLDWVWYYNKYLFSSLEASYLNTQTSKKLEGFSESNWATVYKEMVIKPNIISVSLDLGNMQPFLGLTIEYKDIDRTEFGYFHLSNALGGDWVAFENKTEINAILPFLRLGLNYTSDFFDSYTDLDLMPSYWLEMNQDTIFKPIVADPGIKSSTSWQDPGLTLTQEVYFKSGSYFNFFIDGIISFWSAKYDLKTLEYTDDTFSFKDSNISTLFSYYAFSINVVFAKFDYFSGLKPFVGIGYSWDRIKDRNEGPIKKEDSIRFNFGLKFRKQDLQE